MRHLDLSVGVLMDGRGVDHPDGVALTKPFQFVDDLTVEVGVVEAQHDELYWSDSHVFSLSSTAWPVPGLPCARWSGLARSNALDSLGASPL